MAWTDPPTDKQIWALERWWGGIVPREKSKVALKWLRKHATRREMAEEMDRALDLYLAHNLNKENSFESKIWEGFEYDDPEPSDRQVSLVYAILRRHISIGKAALASNWLKENASMKQVGAEIDRLKALEKRHALDAEECFNAKIWEKYEH